MVEPIRDPSTEDVTRWHRTMAPRLFNRTWEILDHEDRTTEEEDEMLSAAFGQRFHWYKVGSGVNRAVADWQVGEPIFSLLVRKRLSGGNEPAGDPR